MISPQAFQDSRLAKIAGDAHQLLTQLLSTGPSAIQFCEWLNRLDTLVDYMIPGTIDHGLSKLSIKNAKRFIVSNEFGAAKFEIRQLKNELDTQMEFRQAQHRQQ